MAISSLCCLFAVGLIASCCAAQDGLHAQGQATGSSQSFADILSRVSRGAQCRQAVRKVKQKHVRRHCEPYNSTRGDGICNKFLGSELLFANNAYQEKAESNVMMLTKILSSIVTILRVRIPGRCRRSLIESACRQEMPLCDLSKKKPRPLKLCQSACDFVVQQKCGSVLKKIERMGKSGEEAVFINKFLLYVRSRCQQLPSSYESSFLPCYSHFNNERHQLVSTSAKCYETGSVKYSGPISKTNTGRRCQSWSAQCPHRHPFTSILYPELASVRSACRDPGGIRGRPWCFTNDRRTRWQYCRIPKCSDEFKAIERGTAANTVTTAEPPSTRATIPCDKETQDGCNDLKDTPHKTANCISPDNCKEEPSLDRQEVLNEEPGGGLEVDSWVVYLLMGIGGLTATLVLAVISFKFIVYKRRKRIEENNAGAATTLDSGYETVPVMNDRFHWQASRQSSCSTASSHCRVDNPLNSIDRSMTVKV